MSVDGTTIEKIEVLTEAEAKVTALGEREIKLVGQDAKRLLLIHCISEQKELSMKH